METQTKNSRVCLLSFSAVLSILFWFRSWTRIYTQEILLYYSFIIILFKNIARGHVDFAFAAFCELKTCYVSELSELPRKVSLEPPLSEFATRPKGEGRPLAIGPRGVMAHGRSWGWQNEPARQCRSMPQPQNHVPLPAVSCFPTSQPSRWHGRAHPSGDRPRDADRQGDFHRHSYPI